MEGEEEKSKITIRMAKKSQKKSNDDQKTSNTDNALYKYTYSFKKLICVDDAPSFIANTLILRKNPPKFITWRKVKLGIHLGSLCRNL